MTFKNKYDLSVVKKMKKRLDNDGLARDKQQHSKTLLSTGGRIERSHKNVVGNIVNKNLEKRYNAVARAQERIDDFSKSNAL